jgi:TfoX/Sxy family transcriptional regulator of competence genes
MPSDVSFLNYILDQIGEIGEIRTKKMFGEYCIYFNNKPVLWISNNVVMAKKLDCLNDLLSNSEIGKLYPGSKDFYILDCDDSEELREVAILIEKVIEIPKKKKKTKL